MTRPRREGLHRGTYDPAGPKYTTDAEVARRLGTSEPESPERTSRMGYRLLYKSCHAHQHSYTTCENPERCWELQWKRRR